MQAQEQGHERKGSDDFSKLVFGDELQSSEDGENFMMDLNLDPTLSFRQPKYTIYSFRVVFNSILWAFHVAAQAFMKIYVHPVFSVVILLVATGVPAYLGIRVFQKDHEKSGEYIVIDKSLQSFEIPGHKSSQRQDALYVARKLSKESKGVPFKKRRKREAEAPPLFPTTNPPPVYQDKVGATLDLVYLATGDGELNIFTKERIETIHEIEQKLMDVDDFKDYCWKWDLAQNDPVLTCLYDGCTPPVSLIDFFYPSLSRFYDGQGRDVKSYVDLGKCKFTKTNLTEHSIKSTLKLLLSNSLTYWFVDQSFSADNQKSKFLRAQIKFGLPPKGIPSRRHGRRLVRKYLIKYVESVKKMSTHNVRVLYGGSTIYDYEVETTLWADLNLSIYTIVFIAAFLFVFTGFSFFLTFWGSLSILLSLCLAYFFFRIVFAVKSVGILSGISVFIIIGIGVDDVFVFINTFRQAHNAKSLEARMLHTMVTAGKSTFFTSVTTAAAFAANCFSTMPAVRNFGLFMALIVSWCWFIVLIVIPPALNLWYHVFSQCEACLFQRLCSVIPWRCNWGSSDLPDNIVQFLSGNSSHSSQIAVPQSAEADDSSLLAHPDSSPPHSENHSPTSSDIDLSLYDDPNSTFDAVPLMNLRSQSQGPPTVQQEQRREGCHIGFGLQGLLYQCLGVPVQKCRYVVLALFCGILVTSIALDSQIKTSTRPPAFFKKSSNLQQMLDLKYNMSTDNLNTDDVKGFLLKGGNSIPNGADGQTTTSPPENNGAKTPTVGNSSTTSSPEQPNPNPNPKTSKVQHHSLTEKPTKKTTNQPTTPTTTTPVPVSQKRSSTQLSVLTTKPSNSHTEENRKTSNPAIKSSKATTKRGLPGDSGNTINNATITPSVVPTPDVCSKPGSCNPVDKPIVDSSAVVYVIFGLKGIDRSHVTREHVIESKGDVVPDYEFTELLHNGWYTFIRHACRLCKALSGNKDLVKEGGGDCFPPWFFHWLHSHPDDKWSKACSGITPPSFSTGQSQAKLMRMPSRSKTHGNFTYWMLMAFESSIYMGKSSKEAVKDFEKWDSVLKELLNAEDVPNGMKSAFQTSSVWVIAFMEVIAVNSAIYSIAFSLVVCVAAVAIFTANILLTVIVMVTILGVLSMVVAIFYLASWQLGAVEAISLSILVGTSVDYCVHLVEGYILAGNYLPDLNSAKDLRGWRTLAAISHIGTAILSSAITTIVASIPLCLTSIRLFAKFGQILAINTAVSIFFTLTVCMALLATLAPVRFRPSFKATAKSFIIIVSVFLGTIFVLYMVNWKVSPIPGPDGEPLFKIPS